MTFGKSPENMHVLDVPLPVKKKQIAGHECGCLHKWLDWGYWCEDFNFHFTSYFTQM